MDMQDLKTQVKVTLKKYGNLPVKFPGRIGIYKVAIELTENPLSLKFAANGSKYIQLALPKEEG